MADGQRIRPLAGDVRNWTIVEEESVGVVEVLDNVGPQTARHVVFGVRRVVDDGFDEALAHSRSDVRFDDEL